MKVFSFCLLLAVLAACNNQTPKTVQAPKDKIDGIDSITGVANWRLVDGPDTSYLYFSRMGDALVHVYHFSIDKGDSVNTRMNNITSAGDSVLWNWGDKKLLLASANGHAARWEDLANRNDVYALQKTDSLHISFVFPGGHEAPMQLTLPLATFLVRKKYDYIHGTHYSDSGMVAPRDMK
jgi:hypothetical protein